MKRVPHITTSMPPEMKAQLKFQKELEETNQEIKKSLELRKNRKLVKPDPHADKQPLTLPEEYTGRDLKQAKKLLALYKQQKMYRLK